jgi:hypothetical protein
MRAMLSQQRSHLNHFAASAMLDTVQSTCVPPPVLAAAAPAAGAAAVGAGPAPAVPLPAAGAGELGRAP